MTKIIWYQAIYNIVIDKNAFIIFLDIHKKTKDPQKRYLGRIKTYILNFIWKPFLSL